ncbi:hypothetical protein Mag101_08130 [Microbulbifer agarilyticus]|uniref:Peptidase M61 catalytic domain-containing protein n=1 Tax=Microbulbifer agarilyticus TaxID=260552 RepID=A0A1Q2M4M6_9GAMM|nr:hypothetical protein [Microbulbifer agarilyticus]AQQ67610.1 hypothetical protein Mag101_08130 [Microbulbifer agarilyticus]
MRLYLRFLLIFTALTFSVSANAKGVNYYDVRYKAALNPETGMADVTITLAGEELPSKLTLHLKPERHHNIRGDDDIEMDGDKAVWTPKGESASIQYQFVIDQKKGSGHYDSRITEDWAIFRSDKLIPPISVRAPERLHSRATLEITAPDNWRSLAPYAIDEAGIFLLKDDGRRFVRPKGWMIAGDVGSRQEFIDGTDTVVAGPRGKSIRRQDTLSFLNWTLPELKKVFPLFPDRLLIVMAPDPMWRGGLSGTRSLFIHSDRPLISGNRTSSLLHELIHVGTGIRGDKESDWIVEGIAEYYSLQTLRRTGGISERRYQETMEKLATWGEKSPNLLVKRSSGPITARAAVVLQEIDLYIQEASEGENSLDDVVTALAADRGEVTLERFRKLAEEAAGSEIPQLDRAFLSGKKKP